MFTHLLLPLVLTLASLSTHADGEWFFGFENHTIYLNRYNQLNCGQKENTTFFHSCCQPWFKGVDTSLIPQECQPNTFHASVDCPDGTDSCGRNDTVQVPATRDIPERCQDGTEDCENNGYTDPSAPEQCTGDSCDEDGGNQPLPPPQIPGNCQDGIDDCEAGGDTPGTECPDDADSCENDGTTQLPISPQAPGDFQDGPDGCEDGGDDGSDPSCFTDVPGGPPATSIPSPSPSSSPISIGKPTSTGAHGPVRTTGSGHGTYFFQGKGGKRSAPPNPGACGKKHHDSDKVVALQTKIFNHKLCFLDIHITNKANNKSVMAIVADACPGCQTSHSIDLSYGAFTAIAHASAGNIDVSWVIYGK